MQVQVNTNQSIEGHESLERWATDELTESLSRFKHEITRVEVHLSDQNSGKTGDNDKRCLMEARLANQQPAAVSHQATSVDEAFRGALEKLKRLLDSSLGRLKDHRDRDSIRHEAEPSTD